MIHEREKKTCIIKGAKPPNSWPREHFISLILFWREKKNSQKRRSSHVQGCVFIDFFFTVVAFRPGQGIAAVMDNIISTILIGL